MKALKIITPVLLMLMVSVITFFTWNLVFSFVSNYAALSRTSLSFIPMFMFMCEIYTALYALFNYVVFKRQDAYFWRKYSLVTSILSLVGFILSIVCGTYVYGTFVGDYVFVAYPLIMLIVHGALLCSSCYVFITSLLKIKREQIERTWNNSKTFWIKEVLLGLLLTFGLRNLGSIVLLPLFWSSYDSVYVIPFYIQLLVPIGLFIILMIDKFYKQSKKVDFIVYSSVLLYTICSLVYMVVIAKGTYPLVVNPLSPILQLERLITKPIGFVVLYLVSILMPCAYLTINSVKLIKERKEEIK